MGLISRRFKRCTSILAALELFAPLQIIGLFTISLLLLASFIPLQLDGDGILLSIMSIQKLSPYYWAEDKYGNLTPLLAVWIRDPLYNVYAQIFMRLLGGLLAPLFFCTLVLRRPIDAWRATLLTVALLLVVGRENMMHEIFVQANPYGTSLACAGLASLALRRHPRGIGGQLLMLLGAVGVVVSYLVNFAQIVVALPLVGLFAMLFPSGWTVRLLSIHVAAAAISYLLPFIVTPEYQTDLGIAPSLHNIVHYAGVMWDTMRWPFARAVLLPPAFVLAYLLCTRRYRTLLVSFMIMAIMFGVAELYFVVVASSHWLVINDYNIRYFVPGYLLLLSTGGVSLWFAAILVFRNPAMRGAVFAIFTAALLATAGYKHVYGRSPFSSDIIGINKSQLAREVASRYVALSLDGIVGSYWDVWPAVLMAEQYHYDIGLHGSHVLGVAMRGGVRREEFVARLASKGHLRLVCIDLMASDCVAETASEMDVPGLRFAEFAPMEQLPDGHRLWFVEITPTRVPF